MEIQDAEKLARELMLKHNVVWAFQFDRANRRCGSCRYSTRTITLSYEYVVRNDVACITNTILHEIAHAIAGHAAGHGPEWQVVAENIGARPERCNMDEDLDMPKGRWQAVCGGCGYTYNAHRAPKNINGRYCRKCGPVKGALTYDYLD